MRSRVMLSFLCGSRLVISRPWNLIMNYHRPKEDAGASDVPVVNNK